MDGAYEQKLSLLISLIELKHRHYLGGVEFAKRQANIGVLLTTNKPDLRDIRRQFQLNQIKSQMLTQGNQLAVTQFTAGAAFQP